MSKIIRSQRGMSLVEMLSVLTILGILTIAINSIMTSGIGFTEKESSKAIMQQQSNYILTLWREYHEAGDPYSVKLSDDLKAITFESYEMVDGVVQSVLRKDVVSEGTYTYKIAVNNANMHLIYPSINKTIQIQIEINNPGSGSSSYKFETKLSRL